MTDRRGQLVLLAAAALALALVPMLLASLQLGYHGDVGSERSVDRSVTDVERTLDQSVDDVVTSRDRTSWANRSAMATELREQLDPRLSRIETSRIEGGTAHRITYNGSVAERNARENCPGGAGRSFGSCVADGGFVVQERAGETQLVAVAFDIRIVETRGTTRLTLVVHGPSG